MYLSFLKKLTDAGFDAYIVGGFVRDYIIGIKSTDIDITTNATPKQVAEIFKIKESDNLGCINIKKNKLNIDITTFREEKYETDRYPIISYTNDLKTDLYRRDFTINTICMDKDGKIIDILGAREDLDNKILRVVGSVPEKFKNDPLRMLRAIRLSTVLDFQIEDEALSYIINNKNEFKTLSFERIKDELSKMLLSKNSIKGMKLLKTLNILDVLEIKFGKLTFTDDLMGMFSQIEFSDNYKFSKLEKKRINNIKKIVKSGKIDEFTIFKYGFYDSTVAGKILGISKRKVLSINESMPIHTSKDLLVDGNKIQNFLNVEKSPLIKKVKDDLIYNILKGNLKNDEDELIEYILEKWK